MRIWTWEKSRKIDGGVWSTRHPLEARGWPSVPLFIQSLAGAPPTPGVWELSARKLPESRSQHSGGAAGAVSCQQPALNWKGSGTPPGKGSRWGAISIH